MFGVRPLLSRVPSAYDEAGRVPGGWVVAIFAGILLSAYVTEEIGIAVIFGAFIMGAIMPRHAGLTEDVTRRVEDFVVILLLPAVLRVHRVAHGHQAARPAGALWRLPAC